MMFIRDQFELAGGLTLPFFIENIGDGDWFDIVYGNDVLVTIIPENLQTYTIYNLTIPASFFTQRAAPLGFRLHSAGEENFSLVFVEEISLAVVPIPASGLLLSASLLALGVARRRAMRRGA
jgi:hypothetical protein